MPYDDIKFMESEETSTMHINQAYEWKIKNNCLTLKIFSQGKTIRVIGLTQQITQKLVGWLVNNYQFPDDKNIEYIKDFVTKQRDRLNQLLADLENPSVD